jgi:hypothetical protein
MPLVQVSNKDASNAFKQMFAGGAKGKGSTAAAGAKGKAAAASPAKQKAQQAKSEGKAADKQQEPPPAAADMLLQDKEELQQPDGVQAADADAAAVKAEAAAAAAAAGDDVDAAAAAAGESDSADEEMEDLEEEEDEEAEAADDDEADEQAKFKAAFKQAPAGKKAKGKKAATNSSVVEGVGTGAIAAAKDAVKVDVKKLITWKEGSPVPYAFLAETFEVRRFVKQCSLQHACGPQHWQLAFAGESLSHSTCNHQTAAVRTGGAVEDERQLWHCWHPTPAL